MDIQERFKKQVREIENGCHIWFGRMNARTGYGRFRIQNKDFLAHRMALQLKGVDIEGKLVLHSCNNRGCVNPDHLTAGDHKTNMAQMKAEGRARNRYTKHIPQLSEAPYKDVFTTCSECGHCKRTRLITC